MIRTLDISMTRLPVERPDGSSMTYACPGCDIVLADGPAYSWCPACELPVDWVDLSFAVWACATCDLMVNGLLGPAGCDVCNAPVRLISWPKEESTKVAKERGAGVSFSDLFLWLGMSTAIGLILLKLVLFIILAFDPKHRMQVLALFAPLWLIPVVVYSARLWIILRALGGVYDLIRDQRTRVMHGLEHATIAILEKDLGVDNIGGRAYVDGFEIRANGAQASGACQKRIKASVLEAIRRVKSGDTELTLSPQCGTSIFVAAMIQSLWVVALALAVLLGVGTATSVLCTVGPIVLLSVLFRERLGLMAQRHLTVSTAFEDARPLSVSRRSRSDGSGIVFEVKMEVQLVEDLISVPAT